MSQNHGSDVIVHGWEGTLAPTFTKIMSPGREAAVERELAESELLASRREAASEQAERAAAAPEERAQPKRPD